jgi:hypothetical protein
MVRMRYVHKGLLLDDLFLSLSKTSDWNVFGTRSGRQFLSENTSAGDERNRIPVRK